MTTKPAAQQLSRMSAGELLSGQPPEWSVPHAMATIRDRVKGQGTHIAVLDDDPTGTQSVHGVPVLTTWESADLRAALRHPSNAFFVLTNSRGRSRPEAAAISQTIATRLADLADELGIDVEAISRSDSTLRGHFPTEIDALQQGFGERGRRYDGVIICPCFLEAGRVTVNDVQWVREGDQFVPAAGTEFAADATFGYQSSNLRAWVQEKTEGRIPFEEVRSISLADIRNGGPRRVAQLLQEPAGRAVIVNAASYADLEVFVLGLLEAEGAGRRFLYRTGPSFVRVRAGIEPKPVLGPEDIYPDGDRPGSGLVVVGSHAALSTRQLEAAMALGGLHPVELSVPRLLGAGRDDEIDRTVEEVAERLPDSDVVLYTSRDLVRTDDPDESLTLSRSVSSALVDVVARLDRSRPPRFLVAKGGITSSDLATEGLGVRRAEVAGQLLPGAVSVWLLTADSDFPGLPYVIFPGNVGSTETLARVVSILRERPNA
jgi:uncharacterized protein YgbK (DUF1537 family)